MPDNSVVKELIDSRILSLIQAQNFLPTECSGFLLTLGRVLSRLVSQRPTANYKEVAIMGIMCCCKVICATGMIQTPMPVSELMPFL